MTGGASAPEPLHDLTAFEQRDRLAAGALDPTALAAHYLERIAVRNPRLRAFTTVTAERALARVRRLETDDAVREGRTAPALYPLWGLPIGDKDLEDREGVPTTMGSALVAEHASDPERLPVRSTEVVADRDLAGAVSLGKTNTPEFGFPCYTENLLDGGVARNPWDPSRSAGGSSGGAAIAVASGMLPFGPGSDGGGSIRIPAATSSVQDA